MDNPQDLDPDLQALKDQINEVARRRQSQLVTMTLDSTPDVAALMAEAAGILGRRLMLEVYPDGLCRVAAITAYLNAPCESAVEALRRTLEREAAELDDAHGPGRREMATKLRALVAKLGGGQ